MMICDVPRTLGTQVWDIAGASIIEYMVWHLNGNFVDLRNCQGLDRDDENARPLTAGFVVSWFDNNHPIGGFAKFQIFDGEKLVMSRVEYDCLLGCNDFPY